MCLTSEGSAASANIQEEHRAVAASQILGAAALEQTECRRVLIRVDIERLMTSHEMGLVDAALH